jgi:hypothetical protein
MILSYLVTINSSFYCLINNFPASGRYKYFNAEFSNVKIASSRVSTNGCPARLNDVLNRIGHPVNSLKAEINE